MRGFWVVGVATLHMTCACHHNEGFVGHWCGHMTQHVHVIIILQVPLVIDCHIIVCDLHQYIYISNTCHIIVCDLHQYIYISDTCTSFDYRYQTKKSLLLTNGWQAMKNNNNKFLGNQMCDDCLCVEVIKRKNPTMTQLASTAVYLYGVNGRHASQLYFLWHPLI